MTGLVRLQGRLSLFLALTGALLAVIPVNSAFSQERGSRLPKDPISIRLDPKIIQNERAIIEDIESGILVNTYEEGLEMMWALGRRYGDLFSEEELKSRLEFYSGFFIYQYFENIGDDGEPTPEDDKAKKTMAADYLRKAMIVIAKTPSKSKGAMEAFKTKNFFAYAAFEIFTIASAVYIVDAFIEHTPESISNYINASIFAVSAGIGLLLPLAIILKSYKDQATLRLIKEFQAGYFKSNAGKKAMERLEARGEKPPRRPEDIRDFFKAQFVGVSIPGRIFDSCRGVFLR